MLITELTFFFVVAALIVCSAYASSLQMSWDGKNMLDALAQVIMAPTL